MAGFSYICSKFLQPAGAVRRTRLEKAGKSRMAWLMLRNRGEPADPRCHHAFGATCPVFRSLQPVLRNGGLRHARHLHRDLERSQRKSGQCLAGHRLCDGAFRSCRQHDAGRSDVRRSVGHHHGVPHSLLHGHSIRRYRRCRHHHADFCRLSPGRDLRQLRRHFRYDPGIQLQCRLHHGARLDRQCGSRAVQQHVHRQRISERAFQFRAPAARSADF